MQPFNAVFVALASGISNGRDYNSRKRRFLQRGEKFIVPREISQEDLVIINEVTVRGQAGHVAAIQKKSKEVMDRWNPILSSFLTDDKPYDNSQKVSHI
jgi:hypothetical protein